METLPGIHWSNVANATTHFWLLPGTLPMFALVNTMITLTHQIFLLFEIHLLSRDKYFFLVLKPQIKKNPRAARNGGFALIQVPVPMV
jgi:hypothetical protein